RPLHDALPISHENAFAGHTSHCVGPSPPVPTSQLVLAGQVLTGSYPVRSALHSSTSRPSQRKSGSEPPHTGSRQLAPSASAAHSPNDAQGAATASHTGPSSP